MSLRWQLGVWWAPQRVTSLIHILSREGWVPPELFGVARITPFADTRM